MEQGQGEQEPIAMPGLTQQLNARWQVNITHALAGAHKRGYEEDLTADSRAPVNSMLSQAFEVWQTAQYASGTRERVIANSVLT
jgi:hypothetical protein